MNTVTVTFTVPDADARAGKPQLLKELMFDELLRRLDFLERERQGQGADYLDALKADTVDKVLAFRKRSG